MLTHDRPLGRWARPRRTSPDRWDAGLRAAAGRRGVLARRLTRGMALVAGSGLALPLLFTWVQVNRPAGTALPWTLYGLSWAWAGALAVLALLIAVMTAPSRAAPPSSFTSSVSRWFAARRSRTVAERAPARRGTRARRGPKLVALAAGTTSVLLVVLALT